LDPHRNERVSESLREELDELIAYELSDPRVGPASVSQVHLSPDLRKAVVSLVMSGTESEQAATLEAVRNAKQFLKHQLTERLQLFRTPDLSFEAALPATLGARVPQLLKRIKRGRPKSESGPEKNPIS